MKTKNPKSLALLKDLVMQLTLPQQSRVVGGDQAPKDDPETGDPPIRTKPNNS